MDDDQIINLYWARTETAISETAKKYSKYCHFIACNILHSNEDSEECVNDTYLKAWGAIPPKRPNRLSTFPGKITRNLSLDRYEQYSAEKRGYGQVPLVLDELQECIPDTDNVEQVVDNMALVEILNRFLSSLLAVEAIHFDEDMTTRELNAEEVKSVFGNLTVTGSAYFRQENLIGFEGKIDNIKIIITTSDVSILDTIVVGSENVTMVDDVPVAAGYFITKANSQGIKTAIYYATLKLGDSTIYIENAGTEDNSETIKNKLVATIQHLIQNVQLDLNQLQK